MKILVRIILLKEVIAGFTGVSLVDVLLKQDAYQLAKLVAYDCREADPYNNETSSMGKECICLFGTYSSREYLQF